MLRWCHSTRRILDGYGREELWQGVLAASTRLFSVYPPLGPKSAISREQLSLRRALPRSGLRPPPERHLNNNNTTFPLSSVLLTPPAPPEASSSLSPYDAVGLHFLEGPQGPSAQDLSFTRLVSAYERGKRLGTLGKLSEEHLSSILSICGTFSLNERCTFNHPLSRYFTRPESGSGWWSLVLDIAQWKARLGYSLNLADQYWTMRAHLWYSSSGCDAEDAHYESAFNIYLNIKPISAHPDVHVPLYLPLLDTRLSAFIPKAVPSLCSLLETLPDIDNGLSQVFWRITLLYDHCLPLHLKERMCQVLANRVGNTSPNPPSGLSPPDVLEPQDFPAIISAMFFFPCDTTSTILHWFNAQTKSAFDPHIPLEIRWSNLLLVSTICCPGEVELVPVPTTTTTPPSSALWRLLINMGTLQQYLSSERWSSDPAMVEGAAQLLEDFWAQWACLKADCIFPAKQAMLAAFLRVASAVGKSSMTELAITECRQAGLWDLKPGGQHAQSIDLIVACFEASYKSTGSWEGCHATVADILGPDGCWLQDVVELFMMRSSSASAALVCELELWARQFGVHPSFPVFQHFVSNLAQDKQFDRLFSILDDVTLPPVRRECVLYSLLHSLRLHRVQKLNELQSQAIVRYCRILFASRQIPHHMNNSFRYLLTILPRGTKPIMAVQLLETLQHSVLSICSPNFARRFIRQFFLKGNLKLVLLAEGFLAGVLRPVRDSGPKVVRKHWDARPRTMISPLLGIQHLDKTDGVSMKEWNMAIRDAIGTLVRKGRFYTARKLYTRTALHLDVATRTATGNIVLHGSLQGLRLRGRHRFRHVVNIKAYLEDRCRFSPDRTTVNILLKAMLRWTSVFDSERVRHLFDQMIHNGYPAPPACRRENSVPFGHANVDLEGSIFPKLPAGFSFVRHVRPMYKMFIKAFYLRRDVVAAKTVVGILKEVESQHWIEKEKRDRARREGIIRKRARVRQACS